MSPARFREVRAMATLLLLVAMGSLLGHLVGASIAPRPVMVVLCDVTADRHVSCAQPRAVEARR